MNHDVKNAQRYTDEELAELAAKGHCRLVAELQEARQERDEARAWVRRITASERVLTCVYCGEAYPPGTPDHGADRLTSHIKTCAKHPLREAEAEIVRLKASVKRLANMLAGAADSINTAAAIITDDIDGDSTAAREDAGEYRAAAAEALATITAA